MNLMLDENDNVTIILKFGGVLTEVKNQARRRYDGGKKKTLMFRRDSLHLHVIREKLELICPWVRGSSYNLYYHICGTSPKDLIAITNEDEFRSLIAHSNAISRLEVVVSSENDGEGALCPDGGIVRDKVNISNYNHSCCDFVYNDQDNQEQCSDKNYGARADLVIGARFRDAQSFRHAIRTIAILKNFGLRFTANNKSRVVVICAHRGCPWRVRGALCRDGSYFEVRKLEDKHLCPGVNRAGNQQATSAWLAQEIEDSIQKNPDLTPKLINNTLESNYGLSLPYMKVWRAREAARQRIFGSVDDNYRWVPALRAELMSLNPGSHVVYVCCRDEELSFKRFFTSFKVSVDGFLVGCRHLVGLDACHLKSKYLGVLLSANSLDGNNGLFTIAYAVAEAESKSTWKWFLENLALSFGDTTQHFAFISDMEKGLAKAMKTVFPNAEHRVCLRHLWKNMKRFFHCDDNQRVKTLVWTAANAYIKREFDELMNELSIVNPQVHFYLQSLPYKWSRSDFLLETKNHYNTNNMSESFNSWIGEARCKPAVDLVDTIRAMIMEQRSERKQNSASWIGELVPHAEEYLRDVTTRHEHLIVRKMMPNSAEVEENHARHVVDTNVRECSCGVWQATGLPCIHAAAFIGSSEHPQWHLYIHESYHITRYRMAYEGAISAMPGKDQWSAHNDDIIIGVPKSLRPRGRPKKRRMQNFLENTISKTKSIHKCGRCGLCGHHRNTCKNPLSQTNYPHSQIEVNDIEHASCNTVRAKLPIRREVGDSSSENFMIIGDDDPLIRL